MCSLLFHYYYGIFERLRGDRIVKVDYRDACLNSVPYDAIGEQHLKHLK